MLIGFVTEQANNTTAIIIVLATILCVGLIVYDILDRRRCRKKWKKIREECKHEDWIYLRRCPVCDKWEKLNPETNKYEEI